MSEIIELYETSDAVDKILRSDRYLKFSVSENTIKELNKKCDFIMQKQALNWKPLKTERLDYIRIYTRIYYYYKA